MAKIQKKYHLYKLSLDYLHLQSKKVKSENDKSEETKLHYYDSSSRNAIYWGSINIPFPTPIFTSPNLMITFQNVLPHWRHPLMMRGILFLSLFHSLRYFSIFLLNI